MPIVVSGPTGAITSAINNFNAAYHRDFQIVSGLAATYLAAATPNPGAVHALVIALDGVLRNWGACTRQAPCVLPVTQCCLTLMQTNVFQDLKEIRANPVTTLSINAAGVRTVSSGRAPAALDATLIRVLDAMAAGILRGNTNVTYPMKTVLLLTGCIPAFDSQVRKGLSSGGFIGMSGTQMKMPNGSNESIYKKITRLPYLLGDCWRRNPQIAQEAAASSYSWLQGQPGRVFDILLFMQAAGRPVLSWRGAAPGRWYDLH